MAVLGLAVVGAAIGNTFGYASIGWAVGATVGQLLFNKPPKITQEGPRMQDTRVQAATYGVGIPMVFGTARVAGNMIWTSGVREHITITQEESGKGGGQQVETTTYSYDCDVAIGICAGPIVGVRKIWANGVLIYDVGSGASVETILASNANAGAIKFYTGSETQLADPTIEAALGVGNVPAHRGLAYAVFSGFQLASYGNTIPSFNFEVVSAGAVANLAVTTVYTHSSDVAFVGPQFGARDVFAACIDTGAAGNPIGFFQSQTGALVALRSFNNQQLLQLGSAQLKVDRPQWDGRGNAWTFGYGTIGAYLGGWLIGMRQNGEPFKVIYAWPYSGGGLNGYQLTIDDDVAYFCFSGTTVYRIALSTAPDYSLGSTSLTHRETFATVPGGTPPAFSPDRKGRLHLREVYGGTAYLTWASGGAFRSVAISGFNVSDYDASGFSLVNFDLENNPWVAWFEGTGASRRAVLKKVSKADGSILQTITLPNVGGTANQGFHEWVFAEDGFLYVLYSGSGSTGKWYKIEIASGTVLYSTSLANYGAATAWSTRYAVFAGESLAGPQTISIVEPLPRLAASDSETVGGVVSDLCALAGLTAGEIDVTSLTATVHGYVVGRPMTARAAIEQLQKAYFFDGVESDDKLKFVTRGGATAATVSTDNLGAKPAGSKYEPAVRKVRAQEVETPRQVVVNFWNKDADYAEATEYARRLVTTAEAQVFEDLPLALSPDKAAQVAEVLLFDAHMGRNRYQWATGVAYAYLEPTDVVELVDESGTVFTVRIERKMEQGIRIEWEGAAEQASVYSSGALGATDQSGQTTVAGPSSTVLDLLDIPILRSVDDDAGFYAAFSPFSSAGRGAALYGSSDGISFSEHGASTTLTVAGYANTVLASFAGGNTWDGLNTVDVTLAYGTLASATQLEVLNGANLALLGSELIQFTTATLVSGTRYQLSGLLRGRRGTEWAMAGHVAGDRFVLLGVAGLIRVSRPTVELNVARQYRAVTFGSSIADAFTYGFTNSGAGLKPLSPVFLHGQRHAPATNDWTITWRRRGRVDWDLRDYVDVPLGEETEQYSVEILHPTTLNVVRTLATVSSPTATYTAAQQTTDFGAVQTSLMVRVYQLSATIGRGFPAEATL